MSPRSEPRRRAPTRLTSVTAAALAVGLALGGVVPVAAEDTTTTEVTPTPTLATPVLSLRRAPELLRSSISEANIREAIQPLIDDAPDRSCISVSQDGRQLIGKDVDQPMVPASLAKVPIASAILRNLDPEARLTTTAASERGVSNGVIDGDLYIIGGGDPLLSTPGYLDNVRVRYPDQPGNQLAGLADAIAAAGVTEIRGDLVGDDSRYSTERWIPTWPTNYRGEGDVGPLSALMVNDGYEGFADDPDGSGSVEPGDPPVLAVQTLRTLLEDRGISIDGTERAASAPERVEAIAELPSFTIGELVTEFVDDSDNVTGELLTREVGLQRRNDGSTPAGVDQIKQTLHADGLPMEGVNLVDGSGMDPTSTVTCSYMVAALDKQGRDSLIGRALPIAGKSGTLLRRMVDTPAEGNVQAKTGSLAAVSALAGFVTTAAGSDLTFSYIINKPGIYQVYGSLDELAKALAGLDDGPPLEQLEPRAPTV